MSNVRTLLAAAGAATLLLLEPAFPARGQVWVNRGINPWTGTPYRNVMVHNPWTGRVATSSTVVNPWTGQTARNVQFGNPWTGRGFNSRAMYNPWVGRSRWVDHRRRGWW
jgi:hypothetical protein